MERAMSMSRFVLIVNTNTNKINSHYTCVTNPFH